MLHRSVILGIYAAAAVYMAGLPNVSSAEDVNNSLSAAQIKLFETHVRPVLVAHCIKCHGSEKQKGKLRLDSLSAAIEGGESGPAVVPGSPDESLLVEAVRRESFEMPPDEELDEKEIEGLVAWINAGAPWPDGPEYVLRPAPRITEKDREWWAFQPIADPTVPDVSGSKWPRNEIDAFVQRRLVKEGLPPSLEADRMTLTRRAYSDLTGLPPTPAEVAAYLADESPGAYDTMIDRLLDSPRYGEHWARHWLDLVRYADSDGYKQDAFRPEAHRYRDYVIRALNEDKPYDQFVTEQLAGDETDPGNRDALTATMFLRHWIYEYNQRDVETQWQAILDDVTETTAEVFLAQGVACARCHDHKFDPILQKDYYRLQAFFAALLPRDDQPVASLGQRKGHHEQQVAWETATEDLRRRLYEIEHPILLKHTGGEGFVKFVPVIKSMIRKRPVDREPYEHQIASMASRQLVLDRKKLAERIPKDLKQEWESLRQQLAGYDHLKPKPLPTFKFVISDVGARAPITIIPDDPDRRAIAPGYLSVLDAADAAIAPPPAALKSTGRRTALARWITDPANPLTARVIVNRIWQQHFGRGLVATSSDFGHLGEPPSHPELLDWLSRRLMENGWRIKPLHRLIMTSATYRQISNPELASAEALRRDPENRLLWRMNARRLSAEQIRDAMLAVSGELDLTSGGAAVDHDKPRRSVYLKLLRNTMDPLLAAFDAPDAIKSTDRRNETNTATQALLMMNGPWTQVRARRAAQRLKANAGGADDDLVQATYRLALCRDPRPAETKAAAQFIASHPASQPSAKPPEQLPSIVNMPATGSPAVDSQPAGAHLHIRVPPSDALPDKDFTIEAVVLLRSLYPDATVSTIASHWNSSTTSPGWAFGVTSTKSRYQPRNLILQLVGKTKEGQLKYEVVASNLRPELNKPYYLAASVNIGDTSDAGITFYMKDLSEPDGKLQVAHVAHEVTDGYRPAYDLEIGGRHSSTRHYWNGLFDRVRLSGKALSQEELFVTGDHDVEAVAGDWPFDDPAKLGHDTSRAANDARLVSPKVQPQPTGRDAAIVDFVHAILNSNEFLYVD